MRQELGRREAGWGGSRRRPCGPAAAAASGQAQPEPEPEDEDSLQQAASGTCDDTVLGPNGSFQAFVSEHATCPLLRTVVCRHRPLGET